MTPIVILAAGASSRLDKPKQNLLLNGKTLLQRIIRSAIAASDRVLVVLGANADVIETTIKGLDVDILHHEDWQLGMSSSIKQAVSYIQLKYTDADAVAFVVCDQPFVNAKLLQKLVSTAYTVEQGIIGCSYNNTIGVPALFRKIYFPQLLRLNGKEGAKKIIEQNSQDVYSIPFPLGSIDIDTEQDFNDLLKSSDL